MQDELEMDLLLDDSDDSEFISDESEVTVDDETKIDDTTSADDESQESVGETEETEGSEQVVDDNLYSSLAEALKEQGILPNLGEGDKIADADGLVKAFKSEISKNEFNDLSSDQKEYLEAIRSGVPDEVIRNKQSTTKSLDSITDDVIESEDNEDLRKNLISNYFKSKGFDDEDAEVLASQQINSGNDVDFAKKARNKFKADTQSKYDEQLKTIEASKAKEKERFDNLTKMILDDGSIGDLKISKDLRANIYDSVTKVAGEQNGVQYNKIAKYQMDNPEDFQFKLGYLFEITKGFSDFSKLSSAKAAERKAVTKLDKIIRSGGSSIINGVGSNIDKDDTFSLEDMTLDL